MSSFVLARLREDGDADFLCAVVSDFEGFDFTAQLKSAWDDVRDYFGDDLIVVELANVDDVISSLTLEDCDVKSAEEFFKYSY
jgi:hypothetical protein